MTTKKTYYAAFAVARGNSLVNWERINGEVEFEIDCKEPENDLRLSFYAKGENVNMQDFINARHLLLDIINNRTQRR